MISIFDLIERDQARGGRYPCPICGSSDGLSVSPEEGDTGLAHCFSCDWGGTGAQLYATLRDVPMWEALRAFGVTDTRSTDGRRVDRAWKRRRQQEADTARDDLLEWLRLSPYLTEGEILDMRRAGTDPVRRRAIRARRRLLELHCTRFPSRYITPRQIVHTLPASWWTLLSIIEATMPDPTAPEPIACEQRLRECAIQRARSEEDAVRRMECLPIDPESQ